MNKKAQLGEVLQDTAALIFVVLALVVFFIFSGAFLDWFRGHAKAIALEQASASQAHYSLWAWLQLQVEENLTAADLIRLSQIEPEHKTRLEEAKLLLQGYELKIGEGKEGAIFYIPSNQTILVSLVKK